MAGLIGGLVAVVAGAVVLLATGTLDGQTTRIVERMAPAAPLARTPARALDAEQIYANDAPGVVFIESLRTVSPSSGQGTAVGAESGFLLDRDGNILTNAHVVDDAKRVNVSFGGDGTAMQARVVGKDDSNDLAVLHVDPSKVKPNPLPLGDSGAVRVGDPVVAIGNPFGLDRTITSGIVSALQRRISGPNGFSIDHVIQTDAAVNPGSSGGPLIDAQGRVIGINSQIATGGGQGNVGIGFAVPINTAKAELRTLERGAKVAHAFLGVTTVPVNSTITTAMGMKSGQRGVLVEVVTPGSPAAKAGLRAGRIETEQGLILGGDVIVSVDGKDISGPDGLSQVVSEHRPGETLVIGYIRHNDIRSARVRLGDRPD